MFFSQDLAKSKAFSYLGRETRKPGGEPTLAGGTKTWVSHTTMKFTNLVYVTQQSCRVQ